MAKTKKRANGDGSIWYDKSQGRYRGYVTTGFDENGKQKRKHASGKTRAEVKQKLKQIEFSIYSGDFVDKSDITIKNLAEEIINQKYEINQINKNTKYTHESTLNRLKSIYETPLQSVTETQIINFLKTELDKSDSVLRKDVGLLNITFKEAVRRGIITKNPMEYIKTPKSRKKQEDVRALTIDEHKKLLNVLMNEDIKYSDQMLLSMFTGMRMGEINALTKKDVNLRFGTISVNKTISRSEKGEAVLGDTTKTFAGTRTININEDVKTILAECMKCAQSEMLFTTDKGGLISSNQVNMELQRALVKYDIIDETVSGKVSSHSLRHTYATRMIEGGMHVKVLQQLLGHKDITITLNTYCNAFDKYQNESISIANEYLKKNGLTLNKKINDSEAVKDMVKVS